MKAAIMNRPGEKPQYADFSDPVIQNEDEVLVTMKAAAIKNLDRSIASGQHYSSDSAAKPRIIGSDGVGILADGTRVYGVGSGMVAELAIMNKNRMVRMPANLDDATAAALANAVMGAAMGLRFTAGIQPGDTVLVNGATGVTGRVAVQIARHYGAKKIIVTGRNAESLRVLLELGADEIISIQQDDSNFLAQVQAIHSATPIDVIIDYLWGHSAELLLQSLKGIGAFTHRTRYVSVGSVGGETIQLSASILRSVNLQLAGSGLGSWTKQQVGLMFSEILPEMFQLAADGKLKIGTFQVPLAEIGDIYDAKIADGQRLVVVM